MNRIDKIMVESGNYLPMNTELRLIIYLSDKAEERVKQRNIAAGKT